MHGSDPTATTHPDVQRPTSPDRSMLVGVAHFWHALWRPAPARPDTAAAAHARRRRLDGITQADVRDIGLAREDATGIPTMQPGLPFFMQSGFGKRAE